MVKKNNKKRSRRGELYLPNDMYPYLLYSDVANLKILKYGQSVDSQQTINKGQWVYVIEGGDDAQLLEDGSNNIYFKVVDTKQEALKLKNKYKDEDGEEVGEIYSYDEVKTWTEDNVKPVYI